MNCRTQKSQNTGLLDSPKTGRVELRMLFWYAPRVSIYSSMRCASQRIYSFRRATASFRGTPNPVPPVLVDATLAVQGK